MNLWRHIVKRAEVYVFVSITNDMLRNKTEGLTTSKAIRSFIIDCNERGAIAVPNDEHESKLTRFMARHGITKMNQ